MKKTKFKTLLEEFIAYMDSIVRISPHTVSKDGITYKIEHRVGKRIKTSEIAQGFFREKIDERISAFENFLDNRAKETQFEDDVEKISRFVRSTYSYFNVEALHLCHRYNKHLRKLYEPRGILPLTYPSGFGIDHFYRISDRKFVA